MDILSIKQFAEQQNVSYEAIRTQVKRYSEELKDHIIRKNRTQYLDEWAIDFLEKKRKENPVILMNMDQNTQIEELQAQVEILKNKLMQSQDKVIALQEEARNHIEQGIRYNFLLEDNKAKTERLTKAEEQIEKDREKIEEYRQEIELKERRIIKAENEAEGLRRITDEDMNTIENLRRERDAARNEAESFQKSIFGLYRKKR